MIRNFRFHKFTQGTHTIALNVADTGTVDVNSGNLIHMDAGVPTELATATVEGVKKYLVAEDFTTEDPHIVLYVLTDDHMLRGTCDATCEEGTEYEVNDGAITTGTTNPQVKIVEKLDDTTAVFEVLN